MYILVKLNFQSISEDMPLEMKHLISKGVLIQTKSHKQMFKTDAVPSFYDKNIHINQT